MAITGMMGDYLTNLATGQHDPLGTAYRNVTQSIDGTSNVMQFEVYSDDNTRVTAGIDPFSVGISANYYQRIGDWNINGSVGIGFIGGPNAGAGVTYNSGDWSFSLGGSTNFNTYNFSGGVNYNDGTFNIGYYQTYYGGSSDAALNQWNGGVNLGYRNLRIREENDFLLPLKKAQRSDKGRTQAWELGYGSIAVGSFIHTNDGDFASGGRYGYEPKASPIWGLNKHNLGSWLNGTVYNSPLYFGYNSNNRSSRIGYNAWWVQDFQQNGLHQSFFRPGNQNYYLDYSNMDPSTPYLYSGYNNPYSLYGF